MIFRSDGRPLFSKLKQVFLFRTPNSRRNPFEMSSIDHFPEMSPNVFIKREAGEFRWSIEHMAEMVNKYFLIFKKFLRFVLLL